MMKFLLSILIIAIFGNIWCATNDRPIIGVWSQPSSSSDVGCDGSCDYLAASYVKWFERFS